MNNLATVLAEQPQVAGLRCGDLGNGPGFILAREPLGRIGKVRRNLFGVESSQVKVDVQAE